MRGGKAKADIAQGTRATVKVIRSFALAGVLLASASAEAETAPVPTATAPVPAAETAPPPPMPPDPPTLALAVDGPAVAAPPNGRKGLGEVLVIRQEGSAKARFHWKVEPAGRNAADPNDFGGAFPEGTLEFRRGQTSGAISFEVRGLPDRSYPRGFRVRVTGAGGAQGDDAAVEMFIFDEAEAFRPRNDGALFGAKPS